MPFESRPFILDPPSLTDEEKFNAAAYSAGMLPEEAKRLLQGGAASPEQPVAGAGQVEAERQITHARLFAVAFTTRCHSPYSPQYPRQSYARKQVVSELVLVAN